MYRQRRKKLHRRRRVTAVAVSGAVLAITAGAPVLASANTVNDLLHNLGVGNNGSGGSATSGGGATASPHAGNPPSYTPPLHGTEPRTVRGPTRWRI